MSSKLDKIFDSISGNVIFKDKGVLRINHTPKNIPHRDKQIESIASILAPILKGDRPSNLFVYGKTGTGKTLSIKHVTDELSKRLKETNKTSFKVIYINCKLKKVADTEYRILAEMIKHLGESVPATGLPTDTVYTKFVDIIDKKNQIILIVLDEIDQAIKKISDNFLYTLTRLNSELKKAQISLVGISNSLTFMDDLDPRIRSSLGEEELIFPPYNALQLQDILKERSDKSFTEFSLNEGVIAKCAAFAAREHGDARRALDLLRVAGELAERNGEKKLSLNYIDKANNKIDSDKMLDIIKTEPKQFQLVLYAIMELEKHKDSEKIFTGDIYNKYQDVCQQTKNDILTQRRISDIIADYDMLGLINATVISKGRQGRTREIKLMMPPGIKQQARKILNDSFML